MQVTFKLTIAQANRAAAIVAQNALTARPADEQDNQWCGNVLGDQYTHPCWNSDQHLAFDADNGTLTYTGQRHPMVQDGALALIAYVAGYGDQDRPFNPHAHWRDHHPMVQRAIANNFSMLLVTNYVTSDSTMRWWETRSSAMLRLDAAHPYPHDTIVAGLRTNAWGDWVSVLQARVERLRGQYPTIPMPGTKEYLRASAAGCLPPKHLIAAVSLLAQENAL